MGEKKFELGDYVEVKDRIKLFYELFGKGALVTAEVTFPDAGDGKPRVMVKALAYRTPDDLHPGVGYSWLELPGKTPYTNGSEIENAETSAWGRAIGSLGILIDKSIASSQEVQNKQDDGSQRPVAVKPPDVETETLLGDFSRATATVRRRDPKTPIEALQGPDGHVIVLRLEMGGEDKAIPQVVVQGAAGEALYLATSMQPDSLVGHNLSVKGRLYNVSRPNRQSYKRLHVSEWATTDYQYPAKDEDAGPPPPDDVPLAGENEAPTRPLFDDLAVAS